MATILLTLILPPAFGNAQEKTASLITYNLSLAVSALQRVDRTHSTVTTYLTTFDGTSGYPLHAVSPDGLFLFSTELRPRLDTPGAYEADYLEFVSSGYLGYGSLVISPQAQSNQYGIPDLVNPAKVFNSDFTGSMIQDQPVRATRILRGHIYRGAGASLGTISYSVDGITFTNSGTFQITSNSGTVSYRRGQTNFLTLALSRIDADGTPLTGTGSTTFSIQGDRVTIASFKFTSTIAGGFVGTIRSSTLVRMGGVYSGLLESEDGNIATPWRDFFAMGVVVTDANDSDKDGVPDFSDALNDPKVGLQIKRARSGGAVDLEYRGTVGKNVTLYTSSKLAGWTPWITLPNPTGTLAITDQTAENTAQRFYRAAQ
ncbi:MAG: hypothetical protein AB9869_09795 [Verrucomicrobiia bacterium]